MRASKHQVGYRLFCAVVMVGCVLCLWFLGIELVTDHTPLAIIGGIFLSGIFGIVCVSSAINIVRPEPPPNNESGGEGE